MKELHNFIKCCNLEEVLRLLCAGTRSAKKKREVFDQYFSLYCAVAELAVGKSDLKMYLAHYAPAVYGDAADEEKDSVFYVVQDVQELKKERWKRADWTAFLKNQMEVLLPECLLENLDEDVLAALMLEEMLKNCEQLIPKRTNKLLYARVCEGKRGKWEMEGAKRLLGSGQLLRKKDLLGEIWAEEEKRFAHISWADVLMPYMGDEDDDDEDDDEFEEGVELVLSEEEKKTIREALHHAYDYYLKLDRENPVNLNRFEKRLMRMDRMYNNLKLPDYQMVCRENLRIIVEHNASKPSMPLIYVRDGRGERHELRTFHTQELLCMDLCVADKNMLELSHLLAVLIFYMEYPIRTERLMKTALVQNLAGLLSEQMTQKHLEECAHIEALRRVRHIQLKKPALYPVDWEEWKDAL